MKEVRREMVAPVGNGIKAGYNPFRMLGTFALGATAGSILALLYAPASGRVTRRRIGMKFRTLQQTTGRKLGQAQRLLARKAQRLQRTAVRKLHDARTWMTEHVSNGHAKRAGRRALQHA
jgi:gas vesicle protein